MRLAGPYGWPTSARAAHLKRYLKRAASLTKQRHRGALECYTDCVWSVGETSFVYTLRDTRRRTDGVS